MTTVPSPPKRDARQKRYPMRIVRLAKAMYGDGDAWTPTQIRRYLLEQEGVEVTRDTITEWVRPGHREYRRRQQAAARRRRLDGKQATRTPILDRMKELRAADLPFTSIAKVVNLDYGLNLNEGQVRYCLRVGREPRKRASA